MPRTKAKARRGPAGHEFRENMKTEEGRKLNKENKKRKREAQEAAKSAKRAKTSDGLAQEAGKNGGDKATEGAEEDSMNVEKEDKPAQPGSEAPSGVNNSNKTTSPNLTNTPLDLELAKSHELSIMSIVSSSHIQKKVTRALSLLSIHPAVPPAKSTVVMLHAKSKAASKMISIAEILKREIAGKDGKWYQYNKVEQIMEERKQVQKDNGKAKGKDTENVDETIGDPEDDDDEGVESDEESFEVMKTPFERAIEGRPKVRAVPIMTIYLSRIRIESLRKEYGEQTNGLEVLHR